MATRMKYGIYALFFIIVICVFPSCTKCTQGTIVDSVQMAAVYLQTASNNDGSYIYRINTNPEVRVGRSYNYLRHAGTMYALLMYIDWAKEGEDSIYKIILQKNAEFLLRTSLGPVPGHKNMKAIWSNPRIVRAKELEAKLGGAGLGLIALAGLEKKYPGSISLEDLQQLAEFVLFMQNKDGGFCSKYNPDKGGRLENWVSLYYPGEAALGLLTLYDLDKDDRWFNAAYRVLRFLYTQRKGRTSVPADHWALLASAKILSYKLLHPEAESIVRFHALQVAQSMVDEWERSQAKSVGCFHHDGRTTPTATRLEGLLAIYDYIPEFRKELRTSIMEIAHKGVSFLMDSQVSGGTYEGGVTRANLDVYEKFKGKHVDNDFERRMSEIRIDYVQHMMSALMQYGKLLKQ